MYTLAFMSVLSFSRSISIFREAIREDFNFLARNARDLDGWLEQRGASRPFRMAAYGVSGAALLGGFAYAPLQAVGWAAVGVLQLTPFMRDNRHKRANAALGCAILAPQLLALGASVGALQVGIAGTRAYVMNVINDESYRTRIAVSAAFWGGAMAVAAGAGLITSVWSALPLAAMTFGTVADACPDKMTHIARVSRIAGAGLLVPYHLLVSGSWGAVANESLGIVNLFRTAVKNDVPMKDRDDRLLNGRGMLKGWWESMKAMDRVEEDRAGLPDPVFETRALIRAIRGAGPSSDTAQTRVSMP